MRTSTDPDDLAVERPPPTRRGTESRVRFELEGVLEDVSAGAAAALAWVARVLLEHGDDHAGGPARMRVARLGSLLNLWVTDPECSSACLRRSGHLARIAGDEYPGPREVRLFLDHDTTGGLRLHWVLLLAPEPVEEARPGPGAAIPSALG